jgi:isopenicillin N synthase-like dioxygenase
MTRNNTANTTVEDDLDQHPTAESLQIYDSVPVIDVGSLVTGSSEFAVTELAKAAREWGFFQIVNHGIPQKLVDAVTELTQKFFQLPTAEKSEVMRRRGSPWGYYNNELTKNQRDKKEVFDYTTEGADPVYGASNQWPDSDNRFKEVMVEYLEECTSLSVRLVDAFAVGLGLEPSALTHLVAPQHTGFMRLNYYPVADPLADQQDAAGLDGADLGVHHHTDAGILTVLLQHQVSGLQVHKNGVWHNILPADGALVINTGDMMQVLSNDLYRAPVHRVLAMDECDRLSVPFFLNPSASAVIEPVSTAITAERPAYYSSILWSDFRRRRSDGDYANYGTEVQISQYRT